MYRINLWSVRVSNFVPLINAVFWVNCNLNNLTGSNFHPLQMEFWSFSVLLFRKKKKHTLIFHLFLNSESKDRKAWRLIPCLSVQNKPEKNLLKKANQTICFYTTHSDLIKQTHALVFYHSLISPTYFFLSFSPSKKTKNKKRRNDESIF